MKLNGYRFYWLFQYRNDLKERGLKGYFFCVAVIQIEVLPEACLRHPASETRHLEPLVHVDSKKEFTEG